MENSVIRTSSEVGQRVQLNREVKVRDDEPVKVRNEREAIPRDECQPGAKTIKPFLGSVIDRLVSSVSRANTTSAKPEKEETDEANRITALEAFMDANTDEGVREDAVWCWDDHKGCPISNAFHKRKRYASKSCRCPSTSLSRRANRKTEG